MGTVQIIGFMANSSHIPHISWILIKKIDSYRHSNSHKKPYCSQATPYPFMQVVGGTRFQRFPFFEG